jgi:hypothetical protein
MQALLDEVTLRFIARLPVSSTFFQTHISVLHMSEPNAHATDAIATHGIVSRFCLPSELSETRVQHMAEWRGDVSLLRV